MRISTKGRYGLAAMIYLGQHAQSDSYIPLIQLADALGISKIYLEQVFSLLKRADLVRSTKGTQGGYQLAKPQKEITAYAILRAIEQLLFEPVEPSVQQKAPEIEQTMQTLVFDAMDVSLRTSLQTITLQQLVEHARRQQDASNLMFFI